MKAEEYSMLRYLLPRCYLTRTASSRALPTLVPSSDDRAHHRWNLRKGIREELTRKGDLLLPQAANTICNRDIVTVLDYLGTSILVGGRCVFYHYIQRVTPTVISSSSIESNPAINGERKRKRDSHKHPCQRGWPRILISHGSLNGGNRKHRSSTTERHHQV